MAVVEFDKVAVYMTWIGSVVFLLGYSTAAPWWRHPIGQAVAFLDGCIVLTLAPSVLHQAFGVSLLHIWFAWYYGSTLYLVFLITMWRLYVILRVQREAAGPRRLLPPVEPDPAAAEQPDHVETVPD